MTTDALDVFVFRERISSGAIKRDLIDTLFKNCLEEWARNIDWYANRLRHSWFEDCTVSYLPDKCGEWTSRRMTCALLKLFNGLNRSL